MQVDPDMLAAPRIGRLLGLLGVAVGGVVAGRWLAVAEGPAPLAWLILLLVVAATLGVVWRAGWLNQRDRSDGFREPGSGLCRRVYAEQEISRQMANDDRAGASTLALVMIRIDHFDEISGRYGKGLVARVRDLVGRQIKGQVRAGDLAACFDDRCMAVYLRCRSVDQAEAFGRRIAMLLGTQQLEWQGDVIKVSTTIVAVMRRSGEALEELHRQATGRF